MTLLRRPWAFGGTGLLCERSRPVPQPEPFRLPTSIPADGPAFRYQGWGIGFLEGNQWRDLGVEHGGLGNDELFGVVDAVAFRVESDHLAFG